MSKIADGLKRHRKVSGLSVNDVVTKLKERGITTASKTVYGWENGYSEPSPDTLIALCDIYMIDDIRAAFGYTKQENKTAQLMEALESLSDQDQEYILELARRLKEQK